MSIPNSSLFKRIRFGGDPVANPENIVTLGQARFTLLTPRLVRLEWSETGQFEDRGTYAFPIRRSGAIPFTVRQEGPDTLIDTGALRLRYRPTDGPFSAENLSVSFDLNGQTVLWTPGAPNPSNLRGARRTLDGCAGDAALDEGLLSRAGWTLFDDSANVVFDTADGWVAPRPAHALQDWYLFAYGHDYKRALAEYTRFGGQIPLIPRFVLGGWWSRYWAYSAQDLQYLVGEFEAHDVPLDVLVIDMDWHTPHAWTGYTWNRELFPDPPGFLRWVHDKGLRATLNLHPAQGIQHFEEVYPQFAAAMGVDPQSDEAIPFQIATKRFVKPYFELIHHAMEDQGVDFWWMDWQQGESSEVKGLDPLTWLNHIHFNDSRRRGQRPMLYSRWGGLGNHRYHIGFSGDTIVGWPALQFQPYMTATAANVAYGWWSHDIGGHMGGETEPELYARWVQFGALSPCLRLHATKDPRFERRPWAYPDDAYRAARAAFHLRYQLVPYLYTLARVASDTGVSLCRPMYYEHPEVEDAYAARYQYYLGDQAIAAPIVFPAHPATGLAATDVWVPAGTWIDYQTKETLTGPRWARLLGDIDRLPLLVKAGGILPLAMEFAGQAPPRLASGSSDAQPRDWLALAVFPGPAGAFRLYEDDGATEAYRGDDDSVGQFEWTEIRTRMEGETWTVEILPTEGRCEALPAERGYDILLQGSYQPEVVMIDDGQVADWDYNPETLTTAVHVPLRDKRRGIRVTAYASPRSNHQLSALGEAHNRQIALSDLKRLLGKACPPIDAPPDVLLKAVLCADVPGRADAVARLGGPFVRVIELTTPEEAAQRLGRIIVGGPAERGKPYDLLATFVLHRGGKSERCTVEVRGATDAQIIDAPFAFDGVAQTAQWSVEVSLTWQGHTQTLTHTSQPLFPTVTAWHAAVYNRKTAPPTPAQVVDEQGNLNPALDWASFVQTSERLRSVNDIHIAFIGRQHREQLAVGEPLAAYVVTTVTSPDDRQAVLRFGGGGEMTFYLNGQAVAVMEEDAEKQAPMFRETQRTEPMRLHKGKNVLVVHTQPQARAHFWALGAAFTTPDGELMTDLVFA